MKKQPIALARQVSDTQYDAEGFVISEQPHVSEQQLYWLAWRMGAADHDEACESSSIDRELVDAWLEDPSFKEVYNNCMANKREGFRYLSTQLLPKALRTLIKLLDDESVKSNIQGVNLLARVNGLLMDKKVVADADSITRLVEALRAPQSPAPIIIEGSSSALPSAKSASK